MFEVHFSISDNILTMSLGYNTLAEKVYFPLLFLFKTPA
jgi:hypothetical protein